eukprot:PRCOL_00001937-RA
MGSAPARAPALVGEREPPAVAAESRGGRGAPDARGRVVATRDWPFAHEGPVWIPRTGEVFVTSNRLERADESAGALTQRVEMSAVHLSTGEVRAVMPPGELPMANGACGSGSGDAVVCYQGQGDNGGGLAHVDVGTGQHSPLVDRLPCNLSSVGDCGEQANGSVGTPASSRCHFNSPNDVCPTNDGSGWWFTDPQYGFRQKFRWPGDGEDGAAPARVYYLDAATGVVSIAADCFSQPNGCCASPDGQTVYVTDTAFAVGDGTVDEGAPRAIYRCGVGERGALLEPTLVATVDDGVPDGIKCDVSGALFVGCGDGVRVYDPDADPSCAHIGTLVVAGGVSNLVFAEDDYRTLVCCNEKRLLAMRVSSPGAHRNS